MALHDYQCPDCDTLVVDVYRPCTEKASARPPACPRCGTLTQWVPAIGRMDAGSGPGFTAFDQQILQPDGTHKTVRISSLRQLRQIETESLARAKNGEGQPLVWRDYSQDRSNRQVHTLCPVDPATADREEVARLRQLYPSRGTLEIKRHGETDPGHTLGAGVTDASVSALVH